MLGDRPPCGFCSPGTLRTAVRAAGLDELVMFFDDGSGNVASWDILP
jgi:hypothetical protein